MLSGSQADGQEGGIDRAVGSGKQRAAGLDSHRDTGGRGWVPVDRHVNRTGTPAASAKLEDRVSSGSPWDNLERRSLARRLATAAPRLTRLRAALSFP